MSARDSDSEELMERALARMQHAGWINTVVRTKDMVTPHITERGHQRMNQLISVIAELNTAGDPLTDDEFQMVLALIASFPRQR